MTELKTLDDLDGWDEFGGAVSREDLRQEAIKWIKHIQITDEGDYYEGEWEIKTNEKVKEKKIEWIKYFFNITNEELK